MTGDDHTFDSLLDTVECPACGAEVEEGAPTCPTCMQDLRIALAPDPRPRVIRWILDGIDIPEWAQQKKWLWVWGALYVMLLGAVPIVDRFLVHTGIVYWVALGVVVLVALMSWVIAATEIAGDTGSSTGGGLVFVLSFFALPITSVVAMVYLARTLAEPAWRALNWANAVCFVALAGVLIADFVAWMVR